MPCSAKPSCSAKLFALLCFGSWTVASSVLIMRHQPTLRSRVKVQTNNETTPAPSCVALVNHGTHSTVDIKVGTPEQEFSVVADTGSDSVIVPSCICVQNGRCSEGDRCFTGTNHSSTFDLDMGPEGPLGTIITFGSGPVEAVIASDVVRVGKVSTHMENGVLLMIDQNLNLASFEGILGLGLPQDKQSPPPAEAAQPQDAMASMDGGLQDIIQQIMDNAVGGGSPMGGSPMGATVTSALTTGKGLHNRSANASELVSSMGLSTASANASNLAITNTSSWPWPFSRANEESETEEAEEKEPLEDVGFLEAAGVSRFSMCFNEGADGMLRLNPPAAAKTLGNVGRQHWALDFRGISVGDNATLLGFCDANDMLEGQETPCGGIPDSGTTVIMAPQEQLDVLFQSLCDGWDRCRQNYTAMVEAAEAAHEAAESAYNVDPFDIQPASKSALFQFLLFDCGSWLDPLHNLDELPPLHFNVVGSDGTEQLLEMPGWSYVVEGGGEGEGSAPKVCEPAFGAMDYNTQANGPVWIFGTPFFYMFDIGYDLESSPPTISLTSVEESPCGSCDSDGTIALMSGSHEGVAASAAQRRKRVPRRVDGRRWPSIDTSRPL